MARPLCRFVGTARGCSRGAACRFRHPAAASSASAPPTSSSPATPSRGRREKRRRALRAPHAQPHAGGAPAACPHEARHLPGFRYDVEANRYFHLEGRDATGPAAARGFCTACHPAAPGATQGADKPARVRGGRAAPQPSLHSLVRARGRAARGLPRVVPLAEPRCGRRADWLLRALLGRGDAVPVLARSHIKRVAVDYEARSVAVVMGGKNVMLRRGGEVEWHAWHSEVCAAAFHPRDHHALLATSGSGHHDPRTRVVPAGGGDSLDRTWPRSLWCAEWLGASGRYAVGCGHAVVVVDLQTQVCVRRTAPSEVMSVDKGAGHSRDARVLLLGLRSGAVQALDLRARRPLAELVAAQELPVAALERRGQARDGQCLTLLPNGTLRLWDLRHAARPVFSRGGGPGDGAASRMQAFPSPTFSLAGDIVAQGGAGGVVRFWSAATGSALGSWRPPLATAVGKDWDTTVRPFVHLDAWSTPDRAPGLLATDGLSLWALGRPGKTLVRSTWLGLPILAGDRPD